MILSKFESIIRSGSWEGVLTRVACLCVIYFCFLYLPEIVLWMSNNFGTENTSASQLKKHPAVLFIINIFFSLILFIECVNIFRLFKRWQRGSK